MGKGVGNMDERTTVSVLMPMYNCARTLARSVASVQAQTRTDWELLLVDDGSLDDSACIAQTLSKKDSRIRLFFLPKNLGAANARNHALKHARGRYIAFLDADDLWHPQKLDRQISFMTTPGAALSFTAYTRLTEHGALIKTEQVPEHATYHMLLKRNLMGALTVLYDSDVTGKVAMPDLKRQHDYALWLKLIRTHGPSFGLNTDLATYHVSRRSLSTNKVLAALDIWRVFRNFEHLPLYLTFWYFAHYTYYGLRYRTLSYRRKQLTG